MRVNKNEPVAARRRAYFYCVDATDGITPELTEAGGQPQVSVDGAAPTNTGIGVLVAVGNGLYYAEVTQALVNVDDVVIQTRYKSANTAETPGDTLVVDSKVEAAAAAYALLAGRGDRQVRLTVKNALGIVVGDAEVTITTDAVGDVPFTGPFTTNAAGQTPTFMCSPGTYYRWASKSGERFTNPQPFTVV